MAPKPPEESRQSPPPAGDDRPATSQDDRGKAPRQPTANEPMDFGTFVSRSVQSSAERFRQSQANAAASGDNADAAPATRRSPRERSPRYWRDSVGGAPSVRRSRGGTDAADLDAGDGGDGRPPFWASLLGGEDGKNGNRRLWLALAGGILVLLLLAFVLTQLIGGGDTTDDDPTPTPTAETTEIVPGPASTPRTFPTGDGPSSPNLTPTPTEEILQGGDNQLGGDQDTEPEGTPGAWAPRHDLAVHDTGTGDRPSLSRNLVIVG